MKEIKKGASNNRIGEEKNNYQGCLMRIIQYDNSNSIIVEFQDKCKYKKKSSYNNFIKGEIKNPCLANHSFLSIRTVHLLQC